MDRAVVVLQWSDYGANGCRPQCTSDVKIKRPDAEHCEINVLFDATAVFRRKMSLAVFCSLSLCDQLASFYVQQADLFC